MRYVCFGLLVSALPISATVDNSVLGPNGNVWIRKEENPVHELSFTVAMQPSNLDHINSLVSKISDPDNVDYYGHFLSREEVFELTATDRVTVKNIEAALHPAKCLNFGDSLRCTCSTIDLAQIFDTTFSLYQHSLQEELTAVVATSPLTIPNSVKGDIVFVSGLTELPWHPEVQRLVYHNLNSNTSIRGGHTVVPDTIRIQYNVPQEAVTTAVPVAVAEFAGANNEKQSDLSLFGSATGLGNLTITKHLGPENDPQADMTEATLDIQYLAAISLGNKYWVLNSKDWMFTLASGLSNAETENLPTVVSVSYAWNEAQQCHGLPGAVNCSGTDNAGYIERTNIEFQKVALRGTTVLVASGDSGAHGRTDKSCVFNPKMHPDYPASSPFVTTVGGTQFSGLVNTSGVTSPICKTISCAASGYEMVASANGLKSFCNTRKIELIQFFLLTRHIFVKFICDWALIFVAIFRT